MHITRIGCRLADYTTALLEICYKDGHPAGLHYTDLLEIRCRLAE
jgi:hypothetical protein